MVSRITVIMFLVALTAGIYSCQHDPHLEGVAEVSFQNDIRRILNGNCTFSGCHDGHSGETGLTTYEEVMSHVKAGNARGSKIYKAVTNRTFNEMPPSGYPKLSSADIRLLYLWIEQGAKNN